MRPLYRSVYSQSMNKPIGIVRGSGPLVSGLFVVCWSAGFIGSKLGTAHASFDTLLMWRSLALAVVLAPWSITALRRLDRRELGRLAVVGLLSQGIYLLSVYWAIGLGVSTGTVALIDGIQPLVVAALAGPLLRTTVSMRQWLGLACGLIGVAVVTSADMLSPRTSAPVWAYAVPLVSMLALVAATFMESRSPTTASPLQVLAVHCSSTAILGSLLAVGRGHGTPPARADFWLAVAWMVVIATLGGYGLYWWLLQQRGATRLNSLMFLVPPVTAVWGALWFGEPLGVVTVVGLGIGVLAVHLANTSTRDAVPVPTGRPGVTNPLRAWRGSPRRGRARCPVATAVPGRGRHPAGAGSRRARGASAAPRRRRRPRRPVERL